MKIRIRSAKMTKADRLLRRAGYSMTIFELRKVASPDQIRYDIQLSRKMIESDKYFKAAFRRVARQRKREECMA